MRAPVASLRSRGSRVEDAAASLTGAPPRSSSSRSARRQKAASGSSPYGAGIASEDAGMAQAWQQELRTEQCTGCLTTDVPCTSCTLIHQSRP